MADVQAEFQRIASTAAGKIQSLIPAATVDDIVKALTATVRSRIGDGVHIAVGTALSTRYDGRAGGMRSLLITAEDDDGFLTIDRERREYLNDGETVALSRPMKVHRDLITPPFWNGEPSTDRYEYPDDEPWGVAPATRTSRSAGTALDDAAGDDCQYQREDAATAVQSALGTDDSTVVDAINTAADEIVQELMKSSPANGKGPVRFLTTGPSGRPLQCTLRDIELPFATVKTASGVTRINVYTRAAFRGITPPPSDE